MVHKGLAEVGTRFCQGRTDDTWSLSPQEVALEAATKASGWEAAGNGTHTHTSGIVVDSSYRKFPRFSEGFA